MHMKKRGITYLEIIIALSILSIIASISLGFYITNYKIYIKMSSDTDENTNCKIALEYFIDVIMNSKGIKLVNKVEGSDVFVDEICVENAVNEPAKYLLAGTDKIYIVNNIIRCNEKSNHVVSGISSFSIKREKGKLYTITINTDKYSIKTNVYKRE